MTKSTTDKLFEALDESAIELLKRAMGGALETADGDDTLPPASLNEQVRVFAALSSYAKSRLETGPKPKAGNSTFDVLRQRFNGTSNGADSSPVRRANSRKKAQGEPAGGDGAFDA